MPHRPAAQVQIGNSAAVLRRRPTSGKMAPRDSNSLKSDTMVVVFSHRSARSQQALAVTVFAKLGTLVGKRCVSSR